MIFPVCTSFADKAPITQENGYVIQQVDVAGLKSILEANKGKVVFVNFWAIWCGYCVEEIPTLINLYNKYKGEGLEIIGISFDKNGFRVLPNFIKKHGINYPIYLSIDATSGKYELCKKYKIQGFPTSIIYDKDGNMVERIVGSRTEAVFEEKIIKFLNK